MNDKRSEAHEEKRNSATSSKLFIQLAEAHLLQGRYEEAIRICQEGLEKTPEDLRGRAVLGKCYLEKGMFAEAKQVLEKVAEEIEECLPVFKLLSQVYLQEKTAEPALYRAPEREEPKTSSPPPEMNLRQQKLEEQSIPVNTDIQEGPAIQGRAHPEDQRPKMMQTDTLAEIYLKQGHWKKALLIYQEILAREPDNSEVQGKYEMLKKRLGPQQSAASYRKVMQKLERWLMTVAPQGSSPST